MSVTILARSVHGLEWVAADEISSRFPSASDLRLARRELTFVLPALDRALLGLRTVDDTFVQVGSVESVGTARDVPPLLAQDLARLPFTQRLAQLRGVRDGIPGRPRFDVVASIEGRRNYNRFAVANAAGAALAPIFQGFYLERTSEGRQTGEPDLTVRIFLRGTAAVAALRLGRRPLHRRDYKQDTGPGTLHPPVAAALARLVADTGVLIDPFCGDGTIAIESALSYPDALVVGSDLDPDRLAGARRNARRAQVTPLLVRADAANPPWRPGAVNAVVTNPPWNLAVEAGGQMQGTLDPLWRELPDLLSGEGRICAVTDASLEVPAALRRIGYAITLQPQIRLAGRVSHLVLGAPPGRAAPAIARGLADWRRRAIADGVITNEGF
jgi:tRNA (guanine6-N2)-methyltransferase